MAPRGGTGSGGTEKGGRGEGGKDQHVSTGATSPGAADAGGEWSFGGSMVGLPPRPTGVSASPADPVARASRDAEQGAAALARGDFAAAIDHLQRAIALQPPQAQYHLQLGIAADKGGRDDLVERHLLEAARLAPADASPHYVLAAWYYRHGRLDRADESSAAAAALAPDDRSIAISRGTILLALGKAREAWEAMEKYAFAEVPDRWIAHLCARAAPQVNQEEKALAIIQRALRAPGLTAQPSGRPMLHFSAGTLLDRLGRHAEAFEQARLGNETVRTAARMHDPAAHAEWVNQKIRYFTRPRFDALPRATHDNRRPIFVVGMPRSGTSLVEQILASHPQVHGAGELNALRLVAKSIGSTDWSKGATYPESLNGMSLANANQLAAQYLADAGDAELGPDVTYFTDKQPLNFLLLDLVQLLFPRAHVIHCARNPLDTCLSCYMTNFQQSNEFKFDLAHLGAYYRDYRRLMEHWKKVLTVPILEVRYEDLVLDTEGHARRMLEFLNLPWDEACLRYYESDRHVRTASVDQVRQPIYTSSIGRWKHYEKQLASLIAALGRSPW